MRSSGAGRARRAGSADHRRSPRSAAATRRRHPVPYRSGRSGAPRTPPPGASPGAWPARRRTRPLASMSSSHRGRRRVPVARRCRVRIANGVVRLAGGGSSRATVSRVTALPGRPGSVDLARHNRPDAGQPMTTSPVGSSGSSSNSTTSSSANGVAEIRGRAVSGWRRGTAERSARKSVTSGAGRLARAWDKACADRAFVAEAAPTKTLPFP